MRTLNSNINTFDTPRPPTPAGLNHPPPPRRSKTPTLKHHPAPPRPSTPAVAKFPATATADSRCSLGFRDHNHNTNQHVLAVTTTTKRSTSASSSSSAKMPPGDNRPRPPQLSAAAAKTVGRTPLTPKIASKPGQIVTPLVRRTTGNSIASGVNRDDTATPPFLANSITPRSGSRQSRVESTNTTPNGTPNPERSSDGWDPRSSFGFDSGRLSSHTDSSNDNPDSKFFRASDARSSLQQPPLQQRPSSVPQKPATFFYANGTTAEAKRTTSPPIASPYTPLQPEPVSSKFFYANGTPNVSSKPTLQPSGPPSAGSSSSRTMNGRPSTSNSSSGHGYAVPQRPMSPIKMLQQNPPALKPSGTTNGPNNTRPQLASPPQLTPATLAPSKRRVSIESVPRAMRGHARTGSVPAMDSWTSKIPISPAQQSSEPSSPPTSPGMAQPAMTMASILQAAEDLAEESESKDDELPSGLQSPTKSTHSSDPVSELVANARRERKVQDLEITNASLEAINRTLERQLRKQTAEIRRYKRLSRSGALTSLPSSRVTSAALTAPPISLSDLSEEDDSDSEEEEPDSYDDSEFSGTESTSADPSSPIDDKGIARRNRDERRLQLDLTKHRELLVDSQKINQSLKRCLNWTEVLIKEGQKALEYKVRVSDVDFGGHVLAPPDEDEDEDLSQIGEVTLRSYEAGLEPPWEKGLQDRDSGIELPADSG